MAWQDELRQASFRGVPFKVESAEGSFGRRAVVHEYPLRDKPYVEDLGRRAGVHTFEAFVLGPDYMGARDRLVDALDEPGAGRLVHPYKGELTLTVLEYRLRETTAEGGMARFSITAVEAGEVVNPATSVDTQAQVDAAADEAIEAAELDFADSFSCDNFPDFVTRDAEGLLGDVLGHVQGLSGMLPTLPDLKAGFITDLLASTADLASLIRLPSSLGAMLTGLVGRLPGLITNPLEALKPLRELFTFGADLQAVPRTTPSRTQQSDNQVAVVRLVQRAAVIEAARVSSQAAYPSYAEAVRVRDELADVIDVLCEQADNDAVYVKLVDLRAAVVRDITVRGASLARVVNITLLATQPALACAYSLYEDAGRDAEIAERNGVRHPGFMPGGRMLEVLADA